MDSTNSDRRDDLARHVPAIVVAGVAVVAVPLGMTRGIPAVILWLAFAVLSGAVLLFWEAVRLVLDPAAAGDPTLEDEDTGVPVELETRKKAALRALRDIEYERAIHRLGEEDYRVLEAKYRAEARSAMRAIDEGLGAWMAPAEALLARAEADALSDTLASRATGTATTGAPTVGAPVAEAVTDGRACPACAVRNDSDAVFCKKCGTRMGATADA